MIKEQRQEALVKNIIQCIIRLFKQAEKVSENGLIALQGTVLGCGEFVDLDEIGQYIKHALESKEKDCTS